MSLPEQKRKEFNENKREETERRNRNSKYRFEYQKDVANH